MTTVEIVVPRLAGSRSRAQELLAGITTPPREATVKLDLSATRAVAPSFMDEVIRCILVDWGASQLVLWGPSERGVELARRIASNHGVEERLAYERPH